jgi:hypothetical protein
MEDKKPSDWRAFLRKQEKRRINPPQMDFPHWEAAEAAKIPEY